MRRCRGGFTLIETMMFLAASGLMFASAIFIFRGQQQSTQFAQSLRQLESNLTDVINDTSTGVYVQLPDVECRYVGSSPTFSDNPGTTVGQNNSCLFLGKVVQLGEEPFGSGPDATYNVHTMIGSNLPDARSFADTYPSALYNPAPTGPDISHVTEAFELDWGARIKKAFYVDALGVTHYVRGAAVLYSDFGEVASGHDFVSGIASVSLYGVKAQGTASTNPSNSRLSLSDFQVSISEPQTSDFVPMVAANITEPLTICIEGGESQISSIVLGSSQGSITVTVNPDPPGECRT